MNIIYFKDKVGNFGDDLNEWIWDALIARYKSEYQNKNLLGIGSILNTGIVRDKNVVVFGSGAGYGKMPDKKQLEILAVRGRLTTQLLGVDESLSISDGAILLHALSEFSALNEDERQGVIFIPHHCTIQYGNWEKVCSDAGIELLHPAGDSKEIIHKIRKSKLVIADAMHAAIIADTMRVPWVPVVASHRINTLKWIDWLSMFSMPYQPIYIGSPSYVEEKENFLHIKYGKSAYKPQYTQINFEDFIQEINLDHLLTTAKDRFLRRKSFQMQRALVRFVGSNKNKTARQEARVVQALKQAMNSPVFLSDEATFNKNFTNMKNKLFVLSQ